jgi:hypothetical protein
VSGVEPEAEHHKAAFLIAAYQVFLPDEASAMGRHSSDGLIHDGSASRETQRVKLL